MIPKWVGEEHKMDLRKTPPFNFDAVVLPKESFGDCSRSHKCGNVGVELGNGICMSCWDRGLERGHTKQEAVEQKRISRNRG